MAGKATADRIIRVGIDPETGLLDRERALALLADLEATCATIGGMFVMAAVRAKVPGTDDEWETVEYVFRWNSFVPGPAGEPAEQSPGEGGEMADAPAPPAPSAPPAPAEEAPAA